MGDVRDRFVEQGRLLGDNWIVLKAGLAGHCADGYATRGIALDAIQTSNPVDIDQHRWLQHAEIHGGDQALTPSQ